MSAEPGGFNLKLAPIRDISRHLSVPEYYHAAIGTHPRTLEAPREVVFVLHGEGTLAPARVRAALASTAMHHPGARLRLVGHGPTARWRSDGAAPGLRVVENCEWDGKSSAGAGFLRAGRLSLRHGPVMELVLAPCADGTMFFILRAFHAVMDGHGALLFLRDLFGALRGEAPEGCNAAFSDSTLMRSLTAQPASPSRHPRPVPWLTGPPRGDIRGDEWRRIAIGPPRPNKLAHVAAACAAFAHRSSDLPAVIAVPVSLRRHAPCLRSTANFSNMLHVRLYPGEDAGIFRARLSKQLALRREVAFPKAIDLVKLLPMPWLDRLASRTARNYRTRRPVETVLLSNLGRIDLTALSSDGFHPHGIFVVPLAGSAFASLACCGGQVELALNLPSVQAGDGRFDSLAAYLQAVFVGR